MKSPDLAYLVINGVPCLDEAAIAREVHLTLQARRHNVSVEAFRQQIRFPEEIVAEILIEEVLAEVEVAFSPESSNSDFLH